MRKLKLTEKEYETLKRMLDSAFDRNSYFHTAFIGSFSEYQVFYLANIRAELNLTKREEK